MTAANAGIFITEVEPGDGIRLAVKDLFDTAGVRTTYGSILFDEHVPATTAEAVRRLEDAGYAIVGKANLHEFAYGTTSENPHYGTVPNPRAPGRIAGGSSGGSAAALVAGLADAALGSDSGGSVRIPAACCGIVGLKTTWALVPLDGCFPLAPSYDTAGPMARDVATCARMMGALVPGFERVDPPPLDELAVGVAWLEHADPLVRERVAALAARFPRAQPVDLPLDRESGPLFQREVADVHAGLYEGNSDAYGGDVARKIELCLQVGDRAADAAARARGLLREQAAAATDGLDLVVTPTLPCVAPPARGLEDDERRRQLISLTYTINALGWPALALPCGPAEDGLPASAQLVGPPGSEALAARGRRVARLLSGRGGRGLVDRVAARSARARRRGRRSASAARPAGTTRARRRARSPRAARPRRARRRRRGRAASAASRRAGTPAARVPRTRIERTSAMPGQSEASSARQRPVRAHAMSDTATAGKTSASSRVVAGQVAPLGRVDDQPVGDVDELLQLRRRPNGGRPRQRRNTGRSEISSGSTTLAGAAAVRPRRCSSITSVADAAVDLRQRERLQVRGRVDPVARVVGRAGRAAACATGAAPPCPRASARAASSHSGGTHAMCVITLVRRFGGRPSAVSASRSRGSARSTCETVTSSPLHDGERVGISAGATSARRGGAARPPTAGPTSRRRSSGTPAGRAARPPRSRRRATTAPRPRRRG